MDQVIHTLMYKDTFNLYETYDGLYVNGDLVSNETGEGCQYMIFNVLPTTKVESFSYTSMYVIPNFSCFTGVPRTLKIIELANWRGVPDVVIEQLMAQGVECHSQHELQYAESNLVVYSDSGKYKLVDGYWVVDVKRTPNGYLYMVKDKGWKDKFKLGCTQNVDDVKKCITRYCQTWYGMGNVEIVKVVPVFGNVLKANRMMMRRFGTNRGKVVTGSESFVKSKVF